MNLNHQLRLHEGCRFRPYRCPAGHKTIGVGHNIDANPLPKDIADYLKEHGFITNAMVNRLLDEDIELSRNACRLIYPGWDGFSEDRQNALIDMCFNLGAAGLRKFGNTNTMINAGRWNDAAENLKDSKWYRQVGDRAKRICKMIAEG